MTKFLGCMMVSTLALSAAGCDPGDEGEGEFELEFGDEVEFRPDGGVFLNTSSIGTLKFTALDLDWKELDGLTLTDVLVQEPDASWRRLDHVEINSAEIRGRIGTVPYAGEALVGSRWLLSSYTDGPLEMWISEYMVKTNSTKARYTFLTRDDYDQPIYVCGADSVGDRSAIAAKDLTVDPATGAMTTRKRTMYLGCVAGAVGKAYAHGYDLGQLSNLETATRMIRADYCFDGKPWTSEGTSVQARDVWGLKPFIYPEYATEAVWTIKGVACLSQPRRTIYTQDQVICKGLTFPACPADVSMSTYPDTLFWTKLGSPLL